MIQCLSIKIFCLICLIHPVDVFFASNGNNQVVYMALVGSFPFNSFLSGVLSCIGTAVLAGELSGLFRYTPF